MDYLVLKSIHLIFVVTWFAGLFYMPRLFIYFAEAAEKTETEKEILQTQFKIMQRRLWFGITWPSAILVLIFGLSLISDFLPLKDNPWLSVKLGFVFGLYLYHLYLHKIYKDQRDGKSSLSPMALRVINEISTVFLIAIVFLVILKDVISMVYGLIGLVVLIIVLLIGIKIYKNIRDKQKL